MKDAKSTTTFIQALNESLESGSLKNWLGPMTSSCRLANIATASDAASVPIKCSRLNTVTFPTVFDDPDDLSTVKSTYLILGLGHQLE